MKTRVILFVSGVLLISAIYVLGWSSLFTVSSIEVTGTNSQLSTGFSVGDRLARIEPRAISGKLEDLDWVADAQVSRNWVSGKVRIEITERTPVALFNKKVIDSTGKSFALRGKPSSPLVAIQAVNLEAAIKAVIFFSSSLPADLKSALKVVKVRNTGSLILEVDNAGKKLEIRWGVDGDNELKLKVFRQLIALPENAVIKSVDVSAPHAPIVK